MHKLAGLTLIFATTACPAADEGDDGDTTGSGDSSGSASASASMSSTSATTASTSDSTSASTSDSTSASTSASSTASTTVGSEDSSTTDETAGAGTTDAESTGPKDACADLPRKECTVEAGCRPISCRPYVMGGNGVAQWCLGDAEFLGCQAADIGCDDARTVACVGDDAPTYVCPDGCIPDGAMECEPPVEGAVPECP